MAAPLGGEERLEDPRRGRRTHALARVADRQGDVRSRAHPGVLTGQGPVDDHVRRLDPKPSLNNKVVKSLGRRRSEGVIPIGMKCMRLDIDRRELLVTHLFALPVIPAIEDGLDVKAAASAGLPDEIHRRIVADPRLAAPGDADKGEQAVFHLVPLAGARRIVTDRDGQPELVGRRRWR